MSSDVYLATVEDPSLWGTTEQTLVLFLQDGVAPVERLNDPTVIGLRPAAGSWSLRLWDEKSRRAFYQAE
jgi:hypothetical protein